MDEEGLTYCSHETDSRMMVHVAHAANTYNTIILIRRVDSAVVVLAVYAFAQLTSSLK